MTALTYSLTFVLIVLLDDQQNNKVTQFSLRDQQSIFRSFFNVTTNYWGYRAHWSWNTINTLIC